MHNYIIKAAERSLERNPSKKQHYLKKILRNS